MKTLEKKVFPYIEEHQMLLPKERVVAGISGGADSVCLLFVLLEWKKRYGLELAVVHVNHGIRPLAGEDAQFVEELCKEHNISFYLRQADVRALARQAKCSEEEAGRNFRYQAFREVAEEFQATRIVVAHNADDLAETMLFHLFRGSALKGLTGIAPVRDEIIRPLLCVERTEIEQYLAELGQNYCTDYTNDEDDYTRNRIRHHILAYAEQEVVSGCVQNMRRTAELLAETEDYLALQTKEAMDSCVDWSKGCVLDCKSIRKLHPAIGKRVLYEVIKKVAGSTMEMPGQGVKDISRTHVDAMYELVVREGNREINLPYGVRLRREYDKVMVETPSESSHDAEPLEGIRVDFQVLSVEELPRNQENSLIFPQNQYTKWFDYDKIEKSPVLRTRAVGDYLTIRNAEGRICRKRVKDYMVTEKIPASMREQIPVLAEDSHILWLVGYRISEYYKICENTKRVLQVQLITDCRKSCTEEENEGAN